MANKKFSLGIVLSAVDKVTAPLQKVQQKFKGFGDTVQGMKNKWALKSSALGLPALQKSFGGFANSLKPIGYAFGAISIAGVGAFAAIKSSASKLSDLGHLSHSVNMSAESIQKWRYAAQNSESSVEDLDEGLKKFTLSMGQARAGSGRMLSFLNKANPAFTKQLLNVKSNEEAFEMMVNAISKVENPQKRMALSVAAFGTTAGESLARMASSGTASINELRKEAEKLGIVTKKDTVTAEAFGDNLGKMVWALDAVKNTVAVSLMPVLTDFFKKITGWLSENQEKVKGFAQVLADKLPSAIQKTSDFFMSLANNPITKFLVWIVDKLGAANIAFGAIGLYVGGTLISVLASLATLGTALGFTFASSSLMMINGFKAFGLFSTGIFKGLLFNLHALKLAAIANPITAIAIGLAAAGILVYQNWDYVKTLFQDIYSWINKIMGAGLDKLKSILGFSSNSAPSTSTSNTSVQKIAGAQALGAQQMGQRFVGNNTVQKSESEVRVTFDNAPRGTRVQTEKAVNSNLDLSMGYSMVTP